MAEEKSLVKTEDTGNQMEPIKASSMLSLDLSQIKSLSQAMALSGMFSDVKNASQAFVKILAGQEMGIAPFQAMSDIHIIQGKASAGGNIYASKIKSHPKYDYKVKNWTAKGCAIEFFERTNGKLVSLGVSQFDENDAKQANLLGKGSWTTYPRNMYFNRAMTNGVRTYCPDALGGIAAYTPDELRDSAAREVPLEAEEVVHEVKTDDDMPDDFLKVDDGRDDSNLEQPNLDLPDPDGEDDAEH